MNKNDIIELVAEKAELTKAAATKAVEAMYEGITDSLKKDEPVVIAGHGTYTVKPVAAREGRNPSTGEKIQIQATKKVSFKAGKALKDAVKETL